MAGLALPSANGSASNATEYANGSGAVDAGRGKVGKGSSETPGPSAGEEAKGGKAGGAATSEAEQALRAQDLPLPVLQNIVATVNLDVRLDLKTIALHARNAEYNPKVRRRRSGLISVLSSPY